MGAEEGVDATQRFHLPNDSPTRVYAGKTRKGAQQDALRNGPQGKTSAFWGRGLSTPGSCFSGSVESQLGSALAHTKNNMTNYER